MSGQLGNVSKNVSAAVAQVNKLCNVKLSVETVQQLLVNAGLENECRPGEYTPTVGIADGHPVYQWWLR